MRTDLHVGLDALNETVQAIHEAREMGQGNVICESVNWMRESIASV